MASPSTSAKFNAAGFVAGTLIHTKEGLRPIEQIKVGDWVLSQPEGEGELSYKQVTRTFVHESDDLWLLQANYVIKDVEKIHLAAGVNEINGEKLYIGQEWIVTTGGHPYFVKDKGWVKAGYLAWSGYRIKMANGGSASASHVVKIFQTETPNLGWAPDEPGAGHVDGPGCTVELGADGLIIVGRKSPPEASWDFEYPVFIRTLYGFAVQDNHTYYVGELGLWVHDKAWRTAVELK